MGRANRALGALFGRAHIVQVPLELAPFDGTGCDWKHAEEQEALVPRNPNERSHVWLDWCRPAFPALVFFNENERGCVLVEQLGRSGLPQGAVEAAAHNPEWLRQHPELAAAKMPPVPMDRTAAWTIHVWMLALLANNQPLCIVSLRIYAFEGSDGHFYAGSTIDRRSCDALSNRMNRHLSGLTIASIHDDAVSFELDRQNVDLSVCSALALLNCRNIRQEERQPSRQSRRQAERGGAPAFRYHVLTLLIPPSGQSRRDRGGRREPIALHWTRGHFKDYGGRGLFGKHHGLYWWNPHLSGRASRVVSKDYRIQERP